MKTAVLLTNLGSPTHCTKKSIRHFLAEFLSDTRVIEIPKPVWWFILHGIILRVRPKKILPTYESVWLNGESPLHFYSKSQAKKLQEQLGDEFHVELAMRYDAPSIKTAMKKLKKLNIKKLIVLPLYPQYSATTTATTFDETYKHLKTWRNIPECQFTHSYFNNDSYIRILAKRIQDYWDKHGKPEKLLFSFHGLPKRNVKLGDPYEEECLKTATLLADKLKLKQTEWMTVFQSRFGAQEWLKPYCDKTLEKLPGEGVKHIHITCPGFPTDCLETLYEIQRENKKIFIDAGGKQYSYIDALNDCDDHISMLAELCK